MGRKRQGSELFIFMNGEKVGLLSRASHGKLELRYDEKWLNSKSGRPLSLSLPLTDQAYSGDAVENYFDNLLPDSQPIRNRIQKKFGARSNRGFDLLWHVGRDCVGAMKESKSRSQRIILTLKYRIANQSIVRKSPK